MPKFAQFRFGTNQFGLKEPDVLPSGNLRYYDKRCRSRIIMGAAVRGQIAKNSIFRVRRGYLPPDYITPVTFQDHYKYYSYTPAPGSALEVRQTIFRQIMQEVQALSMEARAPYKVLAQKNYEERDRKPGSYKARGWCSYYISDRLHQL